MTQTVNAILDRIERTSQCSINTASALTAAAHREGRLDPKQAIRFRPLFADFDIVNADLFLTKTFDQTLCESVGSLENLRERLS